jgi:signal transduction histidine kinase
VHFGFTAALWLLFLAVSAVAPRRAAPSADAQGLESRKLRQEIVRLKQQVTECGKMAAVGTLAAGIAHEIRNPLVAIHTFFQLAPQRLQDEEFVTSYLKLTEGEVQRIVDLTAELLDLAKPSGSKTEIVDLGDAIETTLRLLAPQARKLEVRMQRAPAREKVTVKAVPSRMKQVLINVVLNALEAAAPNGTVTVSTRIFRSHGAICGRVDIRDTGPGIPSELRDRIFEPFFSTKDKGTGLGLAIARQIVEEHGGYIGVESDPDGTLFSIHVPLSRESNAASVLGSQGNPLSARPRSDGRC